ncbi:MAG: argininosuccinate lyase, partial [Thermoplasmata archaeon]|nr:argininosuccinate lyase [Thermoplasmata archaeon]
MPEKKKPWSGRFQKATAKNVENFTSSIHYDQRLYFYDIQGSIAHATMLAKQGILTK